ncbi:hypothetical protein [Jannaschia pohangensis]|uniref:Uncharacterized protein n=1 Tax=Jannaschia pohangensis TaxID=390807 RepID=A0A1I3SG17_9RHOB|nr:hypothetical protein [Jannaschia pohangensis]SFJ56922.1 hypothetical protein SAMN04488095_3118 [Jannaschia pohangensis]
MTQGIIIQSSSLRVASLPIIWFGFELVFPALYILTIHHAPHISAPFKAVFAAAAVFSGLLALRSLMSIWRIWKADGDWTARVGDGRLTWNAPVPCPGLPLDLPLAEIAEAVRLEVSTTDREGATDVETRYELRLTDGRVMAFDRETSGLDPHRVFSALARHGISYALWTQDLTRDSRDRSPVMDTAY